MNLLAQHLTPLSTDSPARYRTSLRLPHKSAELVMAEKLLRNAEADLTRLSTHREAILTDASFVGSRRQLTKEEMSSALASLDNEIAEARARERGARQQVNELRNVFAETVRANLAIEIDAYRGAVLDRIDEVLELLSIGAQFHEEARLAGAPFEGGLLGAAAVAGKLLKPIAITIAKRR